MTQKENTASTRNTTNMKEKIIVTLSTLCLAFALFSCSDKALDDVSVFQDSTVEPNAFDKWIHENYVMAYNIDLKYHMEDIESDYNYTLVPAYLDKSIQLAHIVRYCWLQAYDEVADINFTRKYVPKVLHFVGSPAVGRNGTMVLGTAEGGLKVTLYMVNNLKLDKDFLNYYYFLTMHHEFTHILTHNKNYDTEFQKISEADYIMGDWYQKYESDALKEGFISNYAMSEYNEDFAETMAFYVVYTPDEWALRMRMAGTRGAAIIETKLNYVRTYMKSAWNIDLDELRDVVQRRMDDVVSGRINLDDVEH